MHDLKRGEKGAVIIASLVFLVTVYWSVISSDSVNAEAGFAPAGGERNFDVPQVSAAEMGSQVRWRQPVPLGDPHWIFDIFTPPVIYYDESTGTFTVTPPFPDANPVEQIFELEFVGIRRVPFRFQLVSYAGARGNFVLTIENLDSGKDVFCEPNETLDEHGIRILGFNEMREVAQTSRVGATEAFDLVGEAIVEDLRTGAHYALRHNETTFLETPIVQFITPDGKNVYLSLNELWKSAHATYEVMSVNLETQTVTVEKTPADVGHGLVKTFQPEGGLNPSDLSNRNTWKSDP